MYGFGEEMGDLLGWLGCLFFTLCGVSQAHKSWKDGHSIGLTISFILFWLGGEVLYIGGTLLKLGWVDWIVWNCLIQIACILVILYYKAWPRVFYFWGISLMKEGVIKNSKVK